MRETPSWSCVPARDACVVDALLKAWRRARPDAVFIQLEDGRQVTFAALHDRVAAIAHGLRRNGVQRGDNVLVWMANSVACVETWFAINCLGAVYVPINTALRGQSLTNVLDNSGARHMVADADLLPALATAEVRHLRRIYAMGPPPEAVDPALEVVDAATLAEAGATELPGLDPPVQPWDAQSIVYTSGTTGPAKGVVSSYAHLYHMAAPHSFTMVGSDDRYLCHLPLFHVGGTIPLMGMLARGASVALVPSFSTGLFWDRVRATRTTVVVLLGVMATFLLKQPPGPRDRDHPLQKAIIIPYGADAADFGRRFGVQVSTLYNMTEISTPLAINHAPATAGSCGIPRQGVELRLVDGNDIDVPAGEVGELIVRTDAPWALCSGYFRNDAATVGAFRNGWFHTGDAFRVQDGEYIFVDRMKDTIRRRGENISSFEIEAEAVKFDAVREAAAIPVPSALSEDDVMCVVAPAPDAAVEPEALFRFLQQRLPYFMVPRYIRIVDALPKTETQKIQKAALRGQGVTPDTWDCEAAGLSLRRSRRQS